MSVGMAVRSTKRKRSEKFFVIAFIHVEKSKRSHFGAVVADNKGKVCFPLLQIQLQFLSNLD
jgi:hypothetical protein